MVCIIDHLVLLITILLYQIAISATIMHATVCAYFFVELSFK